MAPIFCSSCGGQEIDNDHARGDCVCTNCGAVIQNEIIVAEAEFCEVGDRVYSMGQFVSADGRQPANFGSAFNYDIKLSSHEVCIFRAKKIIVQIINQLSLPQRFIESSLMFYKMALNRNITRGRRLIHVTGACTYMCCRLESTSHLLIDISDAIETDVFILGRTFLFLCRELCINVPTLDPCLYIQRFANRMKLGNNEISVSNTAVRLVSRMKRDWIHHGRRPSGLCGAALIVAARLHGIEISMKKMMQIVRISAAVIFKRLKDFSQTPTANLNILEFEKVELEEEMDPPSFTMARLYQQKLQQIQQENSWLSLNVIQQVATTQQQLEKVMGVRQAIHTGLNPLFGSKTVVPLQNPNKKLNAKKRIKESLEETNDGNYGQFPDIADLPEDIDQLLKIGVPVQLDNNIITNDKLSTNDSDNTNLPNDNIQHQMITSQNNPSLNQTPQQSQINYETNWELMDDDDEIKNAILSHEEVESRTKIWMSDNAEYLRNFQIKLEKEAERAATRRTRQPNGSNTKNRNNSSKKQKKMTEVKGIIIGIINGESEIINKNDQFDTISYQHDAASSNKTIPSSKINYEALNRIQALNQCTMESSQSSSMDLALSQEAVILTQDSGVDVLSSCPSSKSPLNDNALTQDSDDHSSNNTVHKLDTKGYNQSNYDFFNQKHLNENESWLNVQNNDNHNKSNGKKRLGLNSSENNNSYKMKNSYDPSSFSQLSKLFGLDNKTDDDSYDVNFDEPCDASPSHELPTLEQDEQFSIKRLFNKDYEDLSILESFQNCD